MFFQHAFRTARIHLCEVSLAPPTVPHLINIEQKQDFLAACPISNFAPLSADHWHAVRLELWQFSIRRTACVLFRLANTGKTPPVSQFLRTYFTCTHVDYKTDFINFLLVWLEENSLKISAHLFLIFCSLNIIFTVSNLLSTFTTFIPHLLEY